VQMWEGRGQSRCRCGTDGSSPGADVWHGWVQSRCRCGRVGASPGADVARMGPVPAQMWLACLPAAGQPRRSWSADITLPDGNGRKSMSACGGLPRRTPHADALFRANTASRNKPRQRAADRSRMCAAVDVQNQARLPSSPFCPAAPRLPTTPVGPRSCKARQAGRVPPKHMQSNASAVHRLGAMETQPCD
jgi:hypothetical protein